jgi:ferredoxin
MKATKTMRSVIRVNPIECQAYGYCAELLPELVTLDEWGYPVLDGRPVPRHLVELARTAAKQCPRHAFLVGTTDD